MKWILTVAVMIYAPLFIARWDRAVQAVSKADGLRALMDPTYLQLRAQYTWSGIALIAILVFMSVISTLKPWTKGDRQRATMQGAQG